MKEHGQNGQDKFRNNCFPNKTLKCYHRDKTPNNGKENNCEIKDNISFPKTVLLQLIEVFTAKARAETIKDILQYDLLMPTNSMLLHE